MYRAKPISMIQPLQISTVQLEPNCFIVGKISTPENVLGTVLAGKTTLAKAAANVRTYDGSYRLQVVKKTVDAVVGVAAAYTFTLGSAMANGNTFTITANGVDYVVTADNTAAVADSTISKLGISDATTVATQDNGLKAIIDLIIASENLPFTSALTSEGLVTITASATGAVNNDLFSEKSDPQNRLAVAQSVEGVTAVAAVVGQWKLINLETMSESAAQNCSANAVSGLITNVTIKVVDELDNANVDDYCDFIIEGDQSYIIPGTVLGRKISNGKWIPVTDTLIDASTFDCYRVAQSFQETDKSQTVLPHGFTRNISDNYAIDVIVFGELYASVLAGINMTSKAKALLQGINFI